MIRACLLPLGLVVAALLLAAPALGEAREPKARPNLKINWQSGAIIGAFNPKFARKEVDFATAEKPGTLIIQTRRKYLYLVLGNNRALRYGVGVGRSGFTWKGTEKVTRKAEWPDWHPPAEMRAREPHLPEFMPGGPKNPMGARALYLGNTEFRIHGTFQPQTIGRSVSSGCIRLANDDVIDLYRRVPVGARVIVE